MPILQILDKLGLPRILPTVYTADDVNLAKVLSLAQRLLNFDILIQLSIHYNNTSKMNMLSVSTRLIEKKINLSYITNLIVYDRWVPLRMTFHFYRTGNYER